MPLLMAVQFPMMFLSGIFFPLEIMPDFMRPIMTAMPLTYLGDSLRQLMVNSSALHSHLINMAVLGGWPAVCLIGAVCFFCWNSFCSAPLVHRLDYSVSQLRVARASPSSTPGGRK